MAKIDLYDPKWVDMVFADKNQAYGAYRLRKGTSVMWLPTCFERMNPRPL